MREKTQLTYLNVVVLGQREVFHLLVDFSTVFLSVVPHENVLVYLSIFQKLILEDCCVARQGLKILPSLLLGIGVHELLVEALLSHEHHGPPIANKIDTFLHVVKDILI